ncbi:unnamed protein product [Gordionus sp. m RMFG-2023]
MGMDQHPSIIIKEEDNKYLTKLIGQTYYHNGYHPEANIKYYVTSQNNIITTGCSKLSFKAYLGIPPFYLPSHHNERMTNYDTTQQDTPPFSPNDFVLSQAALGLTCNEPFSRFSSFLVYCLASLSLARFVTSMLHSIFEKAVAQRIATEASYMSGNNVLMGRSPVSNISPFISGIFRRAGLRRAALIAYGPVLFISFAMVYAPYSSFLHSYKLAICISSSDKGVASLSEAHARAGLSHLEGQLTRSLAKENITRRADDSVDRKMASNNVIRSTIGTEETGTNIGRSHESTATKSSQRNVNVKNSEEELMTKLVKFYHEMVRFIERGFSEGYVELDASDLQKRIANLEKIIQAGKYKLSDGAKEIV